MTQPDRGYDRDERLRHESVGIPDGPVGATAVEQTPGAHRPAEDRRRSSGGALGAALREFFVVTALALVISFVVKTWLLQPFWIPSGSMEDTLLINDRVVVSKLTPGPFDLERGDIVVFEDPANWLNAEPVREQPGPRNAIHQALIFVGLMPDTAENHLIKRVIGLPGDKVACCAKDGRLTVNGTPVRESYVMKGNKPSDIPFSITVPAGKVWVMGDHRSDSSDSRFHDPGGTGKEGSVPVNKVVGKASVVVWPLNRWDWLGTPDSVFATVPNPS